MRQMAAFHRREVAALVQRFSKVVNQTPEWVLSDVKTYAKYDSDFEINPWNNPWDLEDGDDPLVTDWIAAVYHETMAKAYDRALILPVPTIRLIASDSPKAELTRRRSKAFSGFFSGPGPHFGHLRAKFTAMPKDDFDLTEWLNKQPQVDQGFVIRDRNVIQIDWTIPRRIQDGTPKTPNFQPEFHRLGYAGRKDISRP